MKINISDIRIEKGTKYDLLSLNAPAVVADEHTAMGMIDVFKSKSVVITPE